MEGGDSEFTKFTVATFESFLKARSQSLSGNKKQIVARAVGCTSHYFPATHSRCSAYLKNDADIFFYPSSIQLSSVILAKATVVPFVQLRNSRFNFHCYTQCEATPTQKSSVRK